MQNDITLKIVLVTGDGDKTFENDMVIRAYPEKGLYWHKTLKKQLNKLTTLNEIFSFVNGIYQTDIFECDNDINLQSCTKVIIEETVCGDFSYFELELIAEEEDIDPNWPMKIVFEYDYSTEKEKKRKIYLIDDEEELIDVTSKI